jgi:hypothetical protein
MNNISKRVSAILFSLILPVLYSTAAVATSDDGWMEDDQVMLQNRGARSADTAYNPTPANNSKSASSGVTLKGGVTYCVPKGTGIKLKLATVPTYGMKMLDHDLDGKLNPARENQTITAKTTEDIYVDDSKVIPQGTVFQGRVTQVLPPRRVGRPGSVVLKFDSFQTPDGRQFKFSLEANNKRESTSKSKAKGFGLIAAHAAGGAVVGALIAYEVFGLQETIAMHGYNIAGAAAAGALMGTAVALMRHGPEAVLEPGDDLNMEIDTDMLMPAATAPTVKAPPINLPGLDVHVLSTKVIKDGLDGYQLKLKAQIENNSRRHLQSIDMFIEDDNGNRFPMVPDAEEDRTDMLFSIAPCSSKLVYCDFQIEYPKLKRKLIWLDHDNRQIIYEVRLP